MRLRIGIALLALATASFLFSFPSRNHRAPKAAFKQLQALAGNWEGKDSDGGAAKTRFEIVAAGTAVMETISPTGMGMEDMLTLYSVDGDSIVLVHYCPTNNQPRMKATPGAGEVKELTFALSGCRELAVGGDRPSAQTRHSVRGRGSHHRNLDVALKRKRYANGFSLCEEEELTTKTLIDDPEESYRPRSSLEFPSRSPSECRSK